MLTSTDILGPGQRIAARLQNYEHRPQQLEMADAVAKAIEAGEHLVVEAGTGVGKSFGYLVPAILAATADQDESSAEKKEPKRIVVSTHTISLQEQLLQKDVPFLRAVIPREFTAVLVKGRRNYISLRRLAKAHQRGGSIFSDDEELNQLDSITRWANETGDGSLSDLPFRPRTAVWDEVASDSGNCMGRSCPTYGDCFYYRARRRSQNAQILVVNHALFFSDLALRRSGVNIIPDYHAVIFDEAHTIEAVAGDHLGLGVSSGQVDYVLNRLFNDRTNKGLLVDFNASDVRRQVVQCYDSATSLFTDLHSWFDDMANDPARGRSFNGRVNHPDIVDNPLTSDLQQLSSMINRLSQSVDDDSNRQDLVSARDRLIVLADDIQTWLTQGISDCVYWLDCSWNRRDESRVVMSAAPVQVGPTLRETLFQNTKCVVMTSATLAAGNERSFDFFRSRIGLTSGRDLQLGSPFNYPEQAKIIVVRDMPEPTAGAQLVAQKTVEAIKHYSAKTDGRTFVLFTSYDMMRRTGEALAPWLSRQGLALFTQAAGMPRTQMVEQFRKNPRAVLLGTDSFWQGVDVPGDALQTVIISRLPFSVPDMPLTEARLEQIRSMGGNPFFEYQLPEAIIKMRQGFGRLIRTATDHGSVVILDPRVRTKRYGDQVLKALPDCPIEDQYIFSEG